MQYFPFALVGSPLTEIFLSYNREDQARAKLFADAFEALGFQVWWDVGLKAGEAYDEVTEAALRGAKAVVVLWSPRSVTSRWVRAEATLADRQKTLVPAMIEACERPIMFELTQTAELSHWSGEAGDPAFGAFVTDVRKVMASREKATAKPAPVALVPAGAPAPDLRGAKPSLAIMPFTNRSGQSEDDVFADGMVEDLISALSLGRSAKIIAASATRVFRNQAADLRLIGRELGARYILEGNVRRVGANLRVTAQVVEAESGKILWTDRFDRPLAELALLQEDLITEVASQIGAQVTRLEMDRALKKPSDLTAWEAVMRSFSAYGRLGPATIPTAIAEARRATELAPEWGVGHGCLALAVGTAYVYSFSAQDALKQEARAHAAKALALGGHDHNVLWTVAWAQTCVGPREDAVRNGASAVEANPNNANARNAFAQALLGMDRPEDALVQLNEADRLAPRGFNYNIAIANRAFAYWQLGRFEDALACYEKALQIHPGNAGGLQGRMTYLAKMGRMDEAVGALRTLITYFPYATRTLVVAATTANPGIGSIGVEFSEIAGRVWDAMEQAGAA
jgi:TolB-like protein/Tfp pilus assembly protein PilF